MTDYTVQPRRRRWPKRLVYTTIVLLLVAVAGVIAVRHMYDANLQPVGGSEQEKVVVVASGESVTEISQELKDKDLIRQTWAFERYVRNNSLSADIKAGTYKFTPQLSVQQIVQKMVDGEVAVDLVTILPGKRIDQIRDALISAGFDAASVDAALDPARYAGSPALADKPAGASLEGFLYPDSYQKDADTDPSTIIEKSLQEMEDRLTPDIRAAFARQGLSVYQGVTLASIVEREVASASDRAQAAQVFYKRLDNGIALQSDVTALYGAVLDGVTPTVTHESPYNSYSNKGLPPGPISNVTESSLRAVADPADTDWQYFVAGDDGKTHFSKTLVEHEALTRQYCKRLCGE